jgi:hypothetical protein
MGRNWHDRARASGEYNIALEDGRVAGAHGWQHHLGRNWHDRARASGENTIAIEDCHVTGALFCQRLFVCIWK